MGKTVKFEDLTKEQQTEIKKAGKKLLIDGLLTGVNYGGFLFLSNLIIVLANKTFVESEVLQLIALVLVDIKLIKMMLKANAENAAVFANSVKKTLGDK